MRRIHNEFAMGVTLLHWFRNRTGKAAVVLAAALSLASTCASRVEAEAASGKPVDGIRCDEAEGAVLHVHQHIAIFDRGRPVSIPGDVGRPLFAACLYWLHTHASDGLIHVESPVQRSFTLGDFFDIWGEPLSPTRVGAARVPSGRLRAYVNGKQYRGNPRNVQLVEHADITLEAGPPYRMPVPFDAWNGQ